MNSPSGVSSRYPHPLSTGLPSPSVSGLSSPAGRGRNRQQPGCLTHVRMTAGAKLQRFFRRLVRVRQMDFEFAGWQALWLLVAPAKVYRNFMYRKRVKDQWARDDPAFAVLVCVALALSSLLLALVLRLGALAFVRMLLWLTLVDWLLAGLLVASTLWLLANQCLRGPAAAAAGQQVEWAYCWDVHLNAFFPVLVTMHLAMPLCYALLLHRTSLLACLLGNFFWLLAVAYYLYITFLGYTALGFLRATYCFLYPLTFVFIGLVALTTLQFNLSRSLIDFYHYRVS